jgi:hypothetical protein
VTKTCNRCGEAKPLAEFPRNGMRNGEQIYRPRCKVCHAGAERKRLEDPHYRARNVARAAEWYQANTEHHRDHVRKWQHANPDVTAAMWARRRARKRNAPHEPYKRSEIFARWGNLCCYCDAPAEHLDHVHALSKGGADAAHNLVPACAPCNLTKSDKSLADWASTF